MLVLGTLHVPTVVAEEVVASYDALAGPSQADTADYPITLALSGGGARGIAIVGLLRALEEAQITVTGIAGTSIGGIIGGLYACGYTVDEIDSLITSLDLSRLFANAPERRSMLATRRSDAERHLIALRFDNWRPVIPTALSDAQEITTLFTALTNEAVYRAQGDFDRLTIPFRTVATDIVSGQAIVFDSGSLVDAMRATMAFPLAFTGVERDGQVLMDGGIVMPIPVTLARTLATPQAAVVAVDVTSPLSSKAEIVTPVDVAGQVTTIMSADRLAEQLAQADVVIAPDLGAYTASSFTERKELIAIGYAAGQAAVPRIREALRQRQAADSGHVCVESEVGPSTVALPSGTLHRYLTERAEDANWRQASARVTGATTDACQIQVSIDSTAAPADGYRLSLSANGVLAEVQPQLACDIDRHFPSASSVRACLDEISAGYRRAGYDLAVIKRVRYDSTTGTVQATVDEGRIARIDVTGNQRARDWLIRSYLPITVGEVYRSSSIRDGITNLFATGLFTRVTAELAPADSGAVLTIGVDEKPATQVRLGWHWHDEFASEEFLELLDDNLFGIGLQGGGTARVGPDRLYFGGSLNLDRIFFTYFTARLRGYYDRLERRVFAADNAETAERNESRWGAEFYLGQQLSRLGTLGGGLRFERVEFDTEPPNGTGIFNLSTLYFRLSLDNFDRIPFPRSGVRINSVVDLTGRVVGGDVEFTRWQATAEAALRIAPSVYWLPSTAIGLSRSGLPPTEQFYLGGLHSFAGYRTHQLAGDKLLVLSQRLRLDGPFGLRLIGRFDWGDVYSQSEEIKPDNFRTGWGAFLGLDSPLGPAIGGWGRARDGSKRWYIEVGYQF